MKHLIATAAILLASFTICAATGAVASAYDGCGHGYSPRGQYYGPYYHHGAGTVRVEIQGGYRPSNVSPYQSSFYHPHPRGFYYGYGDDNFGYGVFPPTYTAPPPPRSYPRNYGGVFGF